MGRRDNIYPTSLNPMAKIEKSPRSETAYCTASDIVNTFASGKSYKEVDHHTPSVKLTGELLRALEVQAKTSKNQMIEDYIYECKKTKANTSIKDTDLLSTGSSEKEGSSSPQHSTSTATRSGKK